MARDVFGGRGSVVDNNDISPAVNRLVVLVPQTIDPRCGLDASRRDTHEVQEEHGEKTPIIVSTRSLITTSQIVIHAGLAKIQKSLPTCWPSSPCYCLPGIV